jgi:predicted nucleotidyltransferase
MNEAAHFGLSDTTLAKIREVLAQHPAVASAVIYGSRAKGSYKPGSDIDLTLHGAGLSATELMAIAEEFEELLLPYTIDLSLFEQIDNASLRSHVERVGQLMYSR